MEEEIYRHDRDLHPRCFPEPQLQRQGRRARARRAAEDGWLRVWFDEWELKPGDSIPRKVEEGLEYSRVLVLCMSAHAFGSDWSRLEAGTFMFRDPLNKDRHFIPLRLDAAPIKGSLAQLLYVDWRRQGARGEYKKLLEACRPPRAELFPEQAATRDRLGEKVLYLGHPGFIRSVAFSPCGPRVLSDSWGKTILLWDLESGRCLRELEGHSDDILSVAWSPDGHRVFSAAADGAMRAWAVTGSALRTRSLDEKGGPQDRAAYEEPQVHSPLLFKRLKDEIIRLKGNDRVLMRFNELRDALHLQLAGEGTAFKDGELKTVIRLLDSPSVVRELKFGSWVLLQPERIHAYTQAVIQTVRDDELERGCIPEGRVLGGELKYHSSLQRLPPDDERIVLLAMHQTLVERGVCLREHGSERTLLIFPSYYRRERPDLMRHPAVLVSYRFNGDLDDVYATLVVQLHHTAPFKKDQLWRYSADFKTLTGKHLGVNLTRKAEAAGELEVYFDPFIPVEEKIIFSRYIHEHLLEKGRDVVRLRHYVCPHCDTPVKNREVAMERLTAWLEGRLAEAGLKAKIKAFFTRRLKPNILCVKCEKRVPLWDALEECFASPETKKRVWELQTESALVLDNESKERALVGEVISTVALAGQIIEEYSAKRYGLDMEIEFKDDHGKPTAKKLYLQLKSGDSHLRRREGDGAEIFQIHHEDHAAYWMKQAFPVFLVIANSQGEVRWMEIRGHLKRESDNGKKPVKQIVFTGERFGVMSVRRWRERILGEPAA